MIYTAIGRETISDVSSATGFTTSKIPPAEKRVIYALVQVIDGNVRYCIEGTTPEDDLGVRLTQDSTMEVWGAEALKNFRAIDDADSSGSILEVIYFGHGGPA